jgi:hypothetical protein
VSDGTGYATISPGKSESGSMRAAPGLSSFKRGRMLGCGNPDPTRNIASCGLKGLPVIAFDHWDSWGKRTKSSRLRPSNERCQVLALDGAGLLHPRAP